MAAKLTTREKELLEIIAGLVDQYLPEPDDHDIDHKETGCIRINKTALMKLVEVGLMVELMPESRQGESPYRWYDARFVTNWRYKLWREL